MKISAKCGACGSTLLRIPDDDETDQMVRCSNCGKDAGNKSEMHKQLRKAAEAEIEKLKDDLKKTLKKGVFGKSC